MSKYRTMPTVIHGGTVPVVTDAEWIAAVEKQLGRQLGQADRAFAFALGHYHNWTATVVADHLRLMHAAPDLLEACEEAQEVMDAAANQISEDRYIDADELKATANQLADYAMKLRDAILLADPPEFVEE